jgi:DeoR/GlpR family transcriptional regulator of sugar metabolism
MIFLIEQCRPETSEPAMSKSAARADHILQKLLRSDEVSVEDLSAELGVDASTIRRDLERLERQGLLRRVHGGAVRSDVVAYSAYGYGITFQGNMQREVEQKARISQAALQLIAPGDTIALSPGTTTTFLARAIRQAQFASLRVVTNAVNIAMELSGAPGLEMTLTGGILLADFFALVGPLAEQSLEDLFIDKAFLGTHAIDAEHGLTGPNQLEALIYRATLRRARRAIVLADHTKLARTALYRIAPVTAAHTLVTDDGADQAALAAIAGQGLRIIM